MIDLTHRGTEWVLADGTAKLAARSRLPGAHAFDRAAHALRLARRQGIAPRELLAPALASSWLVNSGIPSPVFRTWLSPPFVDVWDELAGALWGVSGEDAAWATFSAEDRATLDGALAALCIEGQGPGAVSKVLALLAPGSLPLMPDAALSFAVGAAPKPKPDALDAQTAKPAAFAPMMDWFVAAVRDAMPTLDALAPGDRTTSPAQRLDHLLWFDSAGWRHFRPKTSGGFVPVRDGGREAVVHVAVALPDELLRTIREDTPLDVARQDLPDAVSTAVRDAAARAFG